MLLFLFKCSILDLSCCRREAAATLLSPSTQALGVLPNYIIGNLRTDPSFSVCIVLSHLINKTSDHCSSRCWIWSSWVCDSWLHLWRHLVTVYFKMYRPSSGVECSGRTWVGWGGLWTSQRKQGWGGIWTSRGKWGWRGIWNKYLNH